MRRTRWDLRSTILRLTAAALFLLLPAITAAQLSDSASKAITGRVVNSAGEPIIGAIIFATPLGTPGRQKSEVADGGGAFKIDNLETGLYRVWANMPGYVSAQWTPGESNYFRPGDSATLTLLKGGVVTGIVSSPGGPAVATPVKAIRLRDAEGKALPSPAIVRERLTDDRGFYRIYGLSPGTYLIAAGGAPRFGGMAPGQYDADSPTYYPSSTRDTATELLVRSGEELTADIQYRSEPGRAISGAVAGLIETPPQTTANANINLVDLRDRSTVLSVNVNSYMNYAFAFYGVPEGEYELSATQFLGGLDILKSEPRRIKVRGTDVTGINLLIRSQASIEGRLVLESDLKAGCAKRRESALQETMILARRYEVETKPRGDEKSAAPDEVPIQSRNLVSEAVPDAKGSFRLRNLASGSYRIDPRPPASGWYVRSITMGPSESATSRNATLAVARDGVTVKLGERLSGLTVTVTEGAASIRGRVTVPEGERFPAGVRLYIVPAEKESATDVLRFFEARPESDGTFAIGNLAPGKYWLITRQNNEQETTVPKRINQDPTLQAELLLEARKQKTEIELKPCQRMTDYELPYQPPPARP
jgi:hypothetical protein